MDLNSILNQVLDVAKNSASKLETGNQTIDSITKVGGGAALGGILSMIFRLEMNRGSFRTSNALLITAECQSLI